MALLGFLAWLVVVPVISSFLLASDCDGGHSEGEGGRPSVLGGIRGGVKEGVFRGGVT